MQQQFDLCQVKEELRQDLAEIKLAILEILKEKNPKAYLKFLAKLNSNFSIEKTTKLKARAGEKNAV